MAVLRRGIAGGNWCYGQVQARLSDLSAPDYAAETQGNPTGNYEHLSMSIKTPVFVVGGNGLIDGKSEPASTAGYDLTLLGAGDWAHWGGGSSFTGFDHKSAGGNQIGALDHIGDPVYGSNLDTNVLLSWNDGAPTASSLDEAGYIFNRGACRTP